MFIYMPNYVFFYYCQNCFLIKSSWWTCYQIVCICLLIFEFQLAEVYGNVFSLRVGSEKMVVVSGYRMVKEALITQIDSFVERPNVPLFHKVFKGIGKYTDHNGI